jgi:mono/diheme cytochrome c family protein/YHS domain-containing protein
LSPVPEVSLFLGRLHPLLVHLPIGLIVLLVFLELLARSSRFKNANGGVGPILALAAPIAIASAACGWLLSLGGGYEDRLLQWHKWSGLAVAAACTAAALAYRLDLRKLYRFLLFASFVMVVGASHYGGALTHGQDYLSRYAPGPLRALLGGETRLAATGPPATGSEAAAGRAVFADVVQPILTQYCVGCHGPEKQKGKLRLDTLEGMKAGAHGPVFIAGDSAKSLMIHFLTLPPGEDDHMPPAGKPQPTPEEIELLRWWIDAGAPTDRLVGELKPPPPVQRILEARLGTAPSKATVVASVPLDQVLPVAEKLADELGVAITALGANEPWLQCNASIAGPDFGDAALARLAPLAANLRWLDLAGTRITDAGLIQIARMPHLVRLNLSRTAVTDAGLAQLSELAELEALSLYSTAVSDAGLTSLQSLPGLRQLYLWHTQVTPDTAKAFAEARLDRAQIQRWETEIEQLKSNIKAQQVTVNLGVVSTNTASTNPAQLNTTCPVSGKPVDPAKTSSYAGTVIAFCCDDCKATFEKDPKPFLAKLGLSPAKTEATSDPKP